MFAEEGFMKTGYERPYGELSRVVSFAKGVLWAPESACESGRDPIQARSRQEAAHS